MQALARRLCSTRSGLWARQSSSTGLSFTEHGRAEDVLQLVNPEVRQPGEEEVLVRMLAAPLNPADVNMIEGSYPIRPTLPATPGSEGVGVVEEVGSQVRDISPGTWVVPLQSGLGTWRTSATFKAKDCYPVPSDLPVEATATLCINPPTAMRMLEEFVDLKEGDVVIQNGANSAVGKLVIQIAQARAIRTINVIRDRPDRAALEEELMALGATMVTTENELKNAIRDAQLDAPALALNCVGGSASAAIAKTLRFGGTMVTYGGMSMKPVSLPTSLFIFKDLRTHGFWLSGGPRSKDIEAKKATLGRLIPLLRDGKLTTRTEDVVLQDYKMALQRYRHGHQPGKLLFRL